MIPLSTHFDLELDATRIKDRRDADRQTAMDCIAVIDRIDVLIRPA